MATTLKVGDKAPEFSGTIESGETVSLSDYKGKKLILFFYPKDNTPGCTAEACNLRDNYSELKNAGFELLGVSPDSERKHQNFIKKFSLPFPLLADTEQETLQAYGVWGPKKFMGRSYIGVHRTTFVIDEDGVIEAVIDKVKTKDHTAQILEVLESENAG
ncbi:thioredoxin-dependent thiol peroxidase [Flavilitoribacter nigricans]|uniref:thioredoxin-dependent peroxiredoxin n=1 Tax=Flavilitoribacter nigricans (strain ATCC 23147 / DSM 23189 / NBRC 102662 / NCIMB 1420 / SS-2) TaxID=1122177 RepID=A0A2D0N460_FLAN2|nr:thioredoxin-dependent thiol peroxidase [Flavilitoribacter nigricans]PHN03166.1 thioredoxin-dependent thiol peroxidase [Flavilitoribacter nigricans DSM 23189 = NBRC 102662]